MREVCFTYEAIREGQRGPYSDSVYHYIVEVNIFTNNEKKQRDVVLNFCRSVLKYGYFSNEMKSPFSPEIIKFEKIDSNKWEYIVNELFTG